MSEDLLSIITYVYNTREYLDECILSILNQTYSNFELLLVVNGPTDGSDEICKRYAEIDSRIKLIIFEENHPPSSIAGSILEKASGKYVGVVDSDDYIDPDMYSQLMNCKEDFDLVISRWKREEGNKTRARCDPLAVGPYRTEEDMEFILNHLLGVVEIGGGEHIKPGIAVFPWNKLYKTSLARKVYEMQFTNMEQFADLVYLWLYILTCKSVLITDICGYHYRIRKGSTCHSPNIYRYIADIQGLYRTLEPVFMAHPRSDILMPQLQMKVATFLNRAPHRIGFCEEAQSRVFVFPFLNLLDNKHIALYGADEIGQAYWRQIRRHNMCEVDMWVDEKWEYHRREGWDVSPVERLLNGTYEYVVIATEQQDKADTIRESLISMGVTKDKLLWKAPVEIF